MAAALPVKTVKTRFLIVSDTHTHDLLPSDSPSRPAFRAPLPQADVALHCGDLTMWGELDEYRKTLHLLAQIDAPLKLVIAGNHDLTLDLNYWNTHPTEDPALHRQAYDMWTGDAAREAGVTYLEEGAHHFKLQNGASLSVYASPYTPEFCDMGFPYSRSRDRFSPAEKTLSGVRSIAEKPMPDRVDVVLTHGPPFGILDKVERVSHVGCKSLLNAASRARPKLQAFGHIHEGWGAEMIDWKDPTSQDPLTAIASRTRLPIDRAKASEDRAVYHDASSIKPHQQTLMVNAAIVNVMYKPVNAPFLVDLELDAS